MVKSLDESVGRLLAHLKKHGLEQNTLVIFTSDNGSAFRTGGADPDFFTVNGPLRNHKGALYEGGIRVPFLARWPRAFPAGKVVDTPVISLDLAATVLTAAGIEVPAREMDGTDLVSLVRTPPSAPRTFYWRMGQRAALREGDWKIVRDGGPRQAGPWRLFNLAADLGESNDLSEKDPARLAGLVKRWEDWNSQQQAPRW